jgi:hypothetical protein
LARFFEPSIETIVNSITGLQKKTKPPISVSITRTSCLKGVEISLETVILVGGFGQSDFLFQRVEESLRAMGLRLCRPHDHA